MKFLIRRIENIHILIWLLKDISWCLAFKPLAIGMILPTLIVSLLVTYHHRKKTSYLVHNCSVICWIIANSIWMVTEFSDVEQNLYGMDFPGKWIAVFFFVGGISILLSYYGYCLCKWVIKKQRMIFRQNKELEKV